jgi:TonB family protein
LNKIIGDNNAASDYKLILRKMKTKDVINPVKRKKRSSTMTGITLSLLIPAAATFIFATASYAKTFSSGMEGERATALQQDPQPTKKDIPFVQVDEMPVFPGGDTAILKYVANNTVYPEAAKKKGTTGKVIVRFIVEKDCTVSDATILQSVDPLLDAEALKVISSLPKFEKPAKNDGVAVRVYYMLPITFALK